MKKLLIVFSLIVLLGCTTEFPDSTPNGDSQDLTNETIPNGDSQDFTNDSNPDDTYFDNETYNFYVQYIGEANVNSSVTNINTGYFECNGSVVHASADDYITNLTMSFNDEVMALDLNEPGHYFNGCVVLPEQEDLSILFTGYNAQGLIESEDEWVISTYDAYRRVTIISLFGDNYELTHHTGNVTFNESCTLLKFKVTNTSLVDNVKVFINDVEDVVVPAQANNYTACINLVEGDNEVIVKAYAASGYLLAEDSWDVFAINTTEELINSFVEILQVGDLYESGGSTYYDTGCSEGIYTLVNASSDVVQVRMEVGMPGYRVLNTVGDGTFEICELMPEGTITLTVSGYNSTSQLVAQDSWIFTVIDPLS